jgi:hypothetical protein
VLRAGDEADNRQQQEHQHAGEPGADEPEVEQGNGQQQAGDDVRQAPPIRKADRSGTMPASAG